ncbi:MAG: hypothetical protein SPH10_07255 [Candidatus Cryptobacteroides sp.]|nr:hypothetical protein [Candidatus Cryptobacteroides sp.]
MIDEVDDGALLVHVLQGIDHATDDAKGIVAATDILKCYLGADGRESTNATTRDVIWFLRFLSICFYKMTIIA